MLPSRNGNESLTSNAAEIATFLNKANPYLPKDAVNTLLLAHGGHHIQQIQQLKDHKYDAEAHTWEEMKSHVYQIADATADALAKQFADKFSLTFDTGDLYERRSEMRPVAVIISC